jgi:hypothetical protein
MIPVLYAVVQTARERGKKFLGSRPAPSDEKAAAPVTGSQH